MLSETDKDDDHRMNAKWTFSCGDIGEEDEGWGGGLQVASSDKEGEVQGQSEGLQQTVVEEQEGQEEEEEEEKLTPKIAPKLLKSEGSFSSIRNLDISSPTAVDGMTPLERARLQLSKKSQTASARSKQKASLRMSLNTLAFSAGAPLDT